MWRPGHNFVTLTLTSSLKSLKQKYIACERKRILGLHGRLSVLGVSDIDIYIYRHKDFFWGGREVTEGDEGSERGQGGV